MELVLQVSQELFLTAGLCSVCPKQAATYIPIEFSVKNENAVTKRLISQVNESRKAKASGVLCLGY